MEQYFLVLMELRFATCLKSTMSMTPVQLVAVVSTNQWVNYLPQWWVDWRMSWVGCLLKDPELLILFAENSQVLLKISVIPIILTFMYLLALNLLVDNQLNSSFWQKLDTHILSCHLFLKSSNFFRFLISSSFICNFEHSEAPNKHVGLNKHVGERRRCAVRLLGTSEYLKFHKGCLPFSKDSEALKTS